MGKGGIAEGLATESGLKKSQCAKILDGLAGIATAQVKSAGKFVIPGVCVIKTRVKPATKAGKREMFGDDDREGEASEDCCEGFPRVGPEKVLLSFRIPAPRAVHWPACRRVSSGGGHR